jgi:hypothetical protein
LSGLIAGLSHSAFRLVARLRERQTGGTNMIVARTLAFIGASGR